MLHLDETLFTKVIKIIVNILFNIISLNHFDLVPTLILNQVFPNVKSLKDFIFEFEKVNLEKP